MYLIFYQLSVDVEKSRSEELTGGIRPMTRLFLSEFQFERTRDRMARQIQRNQLQGVRDRVSVGLCVSLGSADRP